MRDLTTPHLKLILDLLWIDIDPENYRYELVSSLMSKVNTELLLREQPYITYEVSNG
jgi:hypothetical protein